MLLQICERAGWQAQHLINASPARSEGVVALCIRELVACREAGQLDLTIALADAAEAQGLRHPRIEANRERARRAQARAAQRHEPTNAAGAEPSATPRGRAASGSERKPKMLSRLRSSLALLPAATATATVSAAATATAAENTAPTSQDTPRSQEPIPSTPTADSGSDNTKKQRPSRRSAALGRNPAAEARGHQEPGPTLSAAEQLQALQAVCRKAGWAPNALGSEAEADVALACAREMQRCRQADQHALVVALAAEAALLGLDHDRIRDNLTRSRGRARRDSTLAQVQALLQGDRASQEAAIELLLDAMSTDPECGEYRTLLGDYIGRSLNQRSLKALTPELRQATIDLEVNQLLLERLERRRRG